MVLELSPDDRRTEPEPPAWTRAWEMRLVAALPMHPVAGGLLFAGLLIASYAVVEALFGAAPAQPVQVGGIPVQVVGFSVAALAGGYSLAAGYLINAGNAHAMEELRAALSVPVDDANPAPGATLPGSRWWGGAGVLLSLGFSYSVDEAVRRLVHGTGLTTDAIASLIVVPLAFWLVVRAVYFTVTGMSDVADQVEQRLRVDLLDAEQLAPLGRAALRASLLWIGAATVVSVSVLLTGGTPAELAAIGCLLAVATGIFVIPMQGVHRRLVGAKREELRRLRSEIERDREAVRTLGPGAAAAAQRLPGLLAFERRIESVREWPFDTPTLWRFFLLLSIPLASWLGGALVERLVDQLLD